MSLVGGCLLVIVVFCYFYIVFKYSWRHSNQSVIGGGGRSGIFRGWWLF